jgi:tRNA threonylcarbamoyladenosine biosynthesis protein TsaE
MRRLALFLVMILLPGYLIAHPHVWIDAHAEIHFAQEKLQRIVHRWVFDDMFTQSILLDFDQDRNGRIDREESEAIEVDAFSNLRHYGYFTHLVVGSRQIPVTSVERFRATLENDRLVYRFEIPVDLEVRNRWQRIQLGVWDDTYFVEVKYDSPAAAVYGAKEEGVEIEIGLQENPRESYWGGFITPREIRLAYRKTP